MTQYVRSCNNCNAIFDTYNYRQNECDNCETEARELVIEAKKFNNKQCKKGCNCIEIAKQKNNGNEVKNYQCLKPKTPELTKIK